MFHRVLAFRLVRYGMVGVTAFACNFASFVGLLMIGTNPSFATMLSFAVGGQVSFVGHDRFSFGDRHPTFNGAGKRWLKFMPGQFGGLFVNALVAMSLTQFAVTAAFIVYPAATLAGAISTYLWNNHVSHRPVSSMGTSVES